MSIFMIIMAYETGTIVGEDVIGAAARPYLVQRFG